MPNGLYIAEVIESTKRKIYRVENDDTYKIDQYMVFKSKINVFCTFVQYKISRCIRQRCRRRIVSYFHSNSSVLLRYNNGMEWRHEWGWLTWLKYTSIQFTRKTLWHHKLYTSVQNSDIRISTIKTVPKCLSKPNIMNYDIFITAFIS